MRHFSIRGISDRHNSYDAIPNSTDEEQDTTMMMDDWVLPQRYQSQTSVWRFLTNKAAVSLWRPPIQQQQLHSFLRKHGSCRFVFLSLVVLGTGILMILAILTIHNPSSSSSLVRSETHTLTPNGNPVISAMSNGTNATLHKETIPTMLSMIDPDTGLYVYALDNPVYQALLLVLEDRSTPIQKISSWQVKQWPNISVQTYPRKQDHDSNEIYTDDWSWHLTWTSGTSSSTINHQVVQEDDWMLFYCSSKGDEMRRNSYQLGDDLRTVFPWDSDNRNNNVQILEAASFAQIQATHQYILMNNCSTCSRPSFVLKGNASRSDNEWWIPIIPETILRQQDITNSTDCQFGIFHKQNHGTTGPVSYHLVAESKNVLADLSVAKLRIWNVHWSLTDRSDEMVVEFVTTCNNQNDCLNTIPVVEYTVLNEAAKDDATLESGDRVEGSTTTYTAEDLCQSPANLTFLGQFVAPGLLHAIRLVDLQPDTQYQYRLGVKQNANQRTAKESILWNDCIYQFRSPLMPGQKTSVVSSATSQSDEIELLVYADQGCPKYGWEIARQWMLEMVKGNPAVRVIHHFGDLSYAQGAAHIWDEWFRILEPLLLHRGIPLMVAVGNHEYDHESGGLGKDPSGVSSDSGFMPAWGNFADDSGGECGVPVAKRFATMNHNSNSNGVFWYSFDFGLVHTIVLSSEHDLSFGSPQHSWLEHNLRSVDRKRTPWVLVESHRPLYEGQFNANNMNNTAQVGVAMRHEFEDLLHDYHVDLVLAGHYHAYHRSCDSLYRGVCSKEGRGPIHLTIGTAGAHLDETDASEFTNPWTAKVILQTYGYGKITVKNESALLFEFIRFSDTENLLNKSRSDAGTNIVESEMHVLDSVWITRERR